jgi:hypothetical protein
MNSAIAILTYRRVAALKLFLGQVTEWCKDTPIAVFEDCGQIDETEEFLARDAKFIRRDWVYEADVYEKEINGVKVIIFLSHENSGVAGNSNKAMKWFMEETKAEHLCLCNDDLELSGPFHKTYAVAHEKLNVGLFCFCDFEEEAYKWVTVKARGLQIKLLSRMTGIMMSMTRKMIERIGYYDAYNFTFGQEHCDYTNRARLAGFINLNGSMQSCLDVVCPELKHQEIESSLTDAEKSKYNADADVMIDVVGSRRPSSDPFVEYSTGRCSRVAGARDGVGIPAHMLRAYSRVKESRLEGAQPAVFSTAAVTLDLGQDVAPTMDRDDLKL